MLALVLPMMVVAQVHNYKTVTATSGTYNAVTGHWNWDETNIVTIPVIIDMTAETIHIIAKADILLNLYSWDKTGTSVHVSEYTMEAIDQSGTYIVVKEQFPIVEGYAHMLYVIYPDYGIKYELVDM